MSIRFLSSMASLAAGMSFASAVWAADKEKPKEAPPMVARLLKSTPEEFVKQFDKDGDGKVSKDEAPEKMAEMFDKIDGNSDGQLDLQEVEQMFQVLRKRFGQEAPAKPNDAAKPGDSPKSANPEVDKRVDQAFEFMDKNKDGKISNEEANGPLAEHFEHVDANKDGHVDRDELRKALTKMLANQGGPETPKRPQGAANFDTLDRNADGRLTREEAKGSSLADKFDDIDADKDGKISPKELELYYKKLVEKDKPDENKGETKPKEGSSLKKSD